MAKSGNALAAYGAVTAAYWAFMLTDGALRMLVLLHFHTLGFDAISLAYLFLLYEFMGVVTNLSAGWIAARFGLASTLYAGLAFQIVALGVLAQLDVGWSLGFSVVYVMVVQGVSGVAKDLAKMSAKSAVKILAPAGEDGALFRWVALLTGSKNAVKGFGFLLGATLLGTIGFQMSLYMMGGVLLVVLVAVVAFMPSGLPRGRKSVKFAHVFSNDPAINRLSLARLFLFGARDTWFVVGIPVYFYTVLSDGTAAGDRVAFFQIGTFMAIWIIGYGVIQAFAPKLLRANALSDGAVTTLAVRWVGILTFIPLVMAALAVFGVLGPVVVVGGLLAFGAVFALNSSLHSYLILALGKAERITMDVGFYYMANAGGRLLGTLLSGLSYQFGGLALCLATSGILSGLSWISLRGHYHKS
ncbi:MFS transporter [Rhodobacterales bacterium 52_120_T64]|nr:MFS transporter [Rhodobacterales bacterium 52_120_T64]